MLALNRRKAQHQKRNFIRIFARIWETTKRSKTNSKEKSGLLIAKQNYVKCRALFFRPLQQQRTQNIRVKSEEKKTNNSKQFTMFNSIYWCQRICRDLSRSKSIMKKEKFFILRLSFQLRPNLALFGIVMFENHWYWHICNCLPFCMARRVNIRFASKRC